jgi:hypothetical protein
MQFVLKVKDTALFLGRFFLFCGIGFDKEKPLFNTGLTVSALPVLQQYFHCR